MLRGTFQAFIDALEAGNPEQFQTFLSSAAQAGSSEEDIDALLACIPPGSTLDIAQATFEAGDVGQQPRMGAVAATLSMQPVGGSAAVTAESTWPFIDEGQPQMHQWKLESLPACPFPTE